MDKKCSLALSQLVTSRQQVEKLENEVAAQSRENLLIKQQIQEFTDFAEGLFVSIPDHWTMEEQPMALKLVHRAIIEEATNEDASQMVIDEKDFPDLLQLAYEENEMLGKQARTLESVLVELNSTIAGMREIVEGAEQSIVDDENTNSEYKKHQKEDDSVLVHESPVVNGQHCKFTDLHDDLVSNVDVKGNHETSPEVKNMKGQVVVKSSKAKLKKFSNCPSLTMSSTSPSESSKKLLSKLTREKIRQTEVGYDLDKKDQQVEGKITRLGCVTKMTKRKQPQPCQVVLTGLCWGGLSRDVVLNDTKNYEGVMQVSVEGDTAVVEFVNADLAGRYRGQGMYHVIEGYALGVGEVVALENFSVAPPEGIVGELMDDSKNATEVSGVDKDVVNSVAVKVKRRVQRSS